jgi:RNA polymerase sigma-70 factor (ECF subfamily)
MHRATVARWLARAREEILESVEQVVQRDLGLTASEAQSVLRDVRSKLQVSVARLLRPEHESEANDG